MSAVRDVVMSGLSDHLWQQLLELEVLHRAVQQNHERVLRSLDEAVLSDRTALLSAWNQYRAVVADLRQVTANFESLRLTPC